MIEELSLILGSSGANSSLTLHPGSVTIFVGPNNSGKSLILAEIFDYCSNGHPKPYSLLEKAEFTFRTEEEITKELNSLKIGELGAGAFRYGKTNPSTGSFVQYEANPLHVFQWQTDSFPSFARHYLSLYVARLNAKGRFSLTDAVSGGDLLGPPNNYLTSLFQNDSVRNEVRRIVKEAFGLSFVIDPTKPGDFRIRLSRRDPVDSTEEQALDARARKFHSDAIDIEQFSDGVKAFTGLILAALIGDAKCLLIDDPEAFLHPSLSHKLGKELSTIMRQREGNLFVSTHSANFLMGCIQSGTNVNIVRLTYANDNATGKLLKAEDIEILMREPLLRSAGVLEALFVSYVVVTEGDTDRAFYQEINERLLAINRKEGISDGLFINAQNKQTVWNIVSPLRKLGIPTAAIVDIDVIKDGGKEWTKVLEGSFVPKAMHSAMHSHRQSINAEFKNSKKDMKAEGGMEILGESEKAACSELFSTLADYGTFIVPNGEVESWLKGLGVVRRKSEWLIAMFKRLGADPNSNDYVVPATGDVWEFIGLIERWITDEKRKGLP